MRDVTAQQIVERERCRLKFIVTQSLRIVRLKPGIRNPRSINSNSAPSNFGIKDRVRRARYCPCLRGARERQFKQFQRIRLRYTGQIFNRLSVLSKSGYCLINDECGLPLKVSQNHLYSNAANSYTSSVRRPVVQGQRSEGFAQMRKLRSNRIQYESVLNHTMILVFTVVPSRQWQ